MSPLMTWLCAPWVWLFEQLRILWLSFIPPHSLYPLWEAMRLPQGHPALRKHACYRYPWSVLDLPEGISVLAWVAPDALMPWLTIYKRRSTGLLRDWLATLPDYETFAGACWLAGEANPAARYVDLSLPHDDDSGFGAACFEPIVVNSYGGYSPNPLDRILPALLPQPIRKLNRRLWRWLKRENAARRRRVQPGTVWVEPDWWLCYIDDYGMPRRVPRATWRYHLHTLNGWLPNAANVTGTFIWWCDSAGQLQRHMGRPCW